MRPSRPSRRPRKPPPWLAWPLIELHLLFSRDSSSADNLSFAPSPPLLNPLTQKDCEISPTAPRQARYGRAGCLRGPATIVSRRRGRNSDSPDRRTPPSAGFGRSLRSQEYRDNRQAPARRPEIQP